MRFTYHNLEKLFSFLKKNYPITPLGMWKNKKTVILRHDVDFDIKAAYRLSLLEEKYGIRSTFFLMATCHTYNLLSIENRAMILKMAKAGFEIGLHFNCAIYGLVSQKELIKKIDFEAAILSSITGQKVKSISQHRPNAQGRYFLVEGYHNAYDPKIFSSEQYFSDSRMTFQKDIYHFLEKPKKFPIQILLHPFHYNNSQKDYQGMIHQFVDDFIGQIDDDFRKMTSYRAQVKKGELKSNILKKYHHEN